MTIRRHAVYATNYLMRVVDVMITKPSELAFYPVPKIFNERVGGHEMWGAIRGPSWATVPRKPGRSSIASRPSTSWRPRPTCFQIYCDCIVRNKGIGIYDGAYRCVELATGLKFERRPAPTPVV